MHPKEIVNTIFHHNGELETGWTFWENYRPVEKMDKMTKVQGEKNYDQNLAQVFTFHDLNQFALYWNCCKYDDSANLIYSTVDETEKK